MYHAVQGLCALVVCISSVWVKLQVVMHKLHDCLVACLRLTGHLPASAAPAGACMCMVSAPAVVCALPADVAGRAGAGVPPHGREECVHADWQGGRPAGTRAHSCGLPGQVEGGGGQKGFMCTRQQPAAGRRKHAVVGASPCCVSCAGAACKHTCHIRDAPDKSKCHHLPINNINMRV